MLVSILDNRKKLLFVLVLLVMLCISMSACVDMYAGTRPFDYRDSIWLCEEPYIYMTVDDKGQTDAYMKTENGMQRFEVHFDYGTGVEAFEYGATMIDDETVLFQGDCDFGRKRFTVTLAKDNVWQEKYRTLTFVRTNELPSS